MKRILILGGGFAGIECCLKLESYFKHDTSIEITLVSEDNFLLFTPMLPQVASGTIETRHVITPIRSMIKKSKFFEAMIIHTEKLLHYMVRQKTVVYNYIIIFL